MAIQKFVVPGELPTLNKVIDQTKDHWSKYSSGKSAHTLRIKAIARKLKPVHTMVFLRCVWYCKNRRQDPDNIAFAKKYILDGLVAAGILPSDGWRHVSGFLDQFEVDRQRPRVEVHLLQPGQKGTAMQ